MSEKHDRDSDVLVVKLRVWTREHDLCVRAAVEMLIGYGAWLRLAGFAWACMNSADLAARNGWAAARLNAHPGPNESVGELVILDLAVAFGENRYWLSITGQASGFPIAAAVGWVVGVDR